MKRKYIWYGIFLLPFIIFFIIIHSIKGHWYLVNADDFYQDSEGLRWYYGFYPEIYFNSNGSFSNSDNGSILGIYSADDGILTLHYNDYSESGVYAYKIRFGKLYIYEGNKEYIYARYINEVASEPILRVEIVCSEDKDIFSINDTDVEKLTLVIDEASDDLQYKYGICVKLNSEKEERLVDFFDDHVPLSHNITINCVGMNQNLPIINNLSSEGSLFIAYFDDETAAREYCNSWE